jgi:hypothetical protein
MLNNNHSEFKRSRERCSFQGGFQPQQRFSDFIRVAKPESRARRALFTDENRHAPASGSKSGLVGVIIAEVDRQGTAKLTGLHASSESRAFVGDAQGDDIDVAQILADMKQLPKWA